MKSGQSQTLVVSVQEIDMSDLSWQRKRSSLNPTGSPISPWLHIDLALILSCLTLGVTGVLMVYSATRGSDPTMYDMSFL